jgi:hypothetical protein
LVAIPIAEVRKSSEDLAATLEWAPQPGDRLAAKLWGWRSAGPGNGDPHSKSLHEFLQEPTGALAGQRSVRGEETVIYNGAGLATSGCGAILSLKNNAFHKSPGGRLWL